MKLEEFPTIEPKGKLKPEVVELRKNSGNYFAKITERLHNEGVFQDIQSIDDLLPKNISPLKGGESSSTYWVRDKNRSVVIKFRLHGADAETEWLTAVGKAAVAVPHLELFGFVQGEQIAGKPIKYVALEGIVDEKGDRAKIGYDFYQQDELLAAISYEAGKELAKVHHVVAERQFGGFADTFQGIRSARTWLEYLDRNLGYTSLPEVGINISEREAILSAIRLIHFPDKGVYAHGDFGLHNILVRSTDPASVVIFDPNPIIADPYFDIAPQYNRMELKRAKYEEDPTNEYHKAAWVIEKIYFNNLMRGYKEATGADIDPKRLAANQLVKLMESVKNEMNYRDSDMAEWEKASRQLEIKIRKRFIREKVDFLVGNQPSTRNSTPKPIIPPKF